MGGWPQDFRYAVRSLLRSPAFSITAVLTIALGIGVNVAVFDLIHAVLLDPLPYRDSTRLVHLAETQPDFPSYQVAVPDFLDWQKTATSFEEMAAAGPITKAAGIPVPSLLREP